MHPASTSVLSKNFLKQGLGPAFFVSEEAVATADDLRRIALSLAGTTEAPHFDRTAFKVKRIYATLAADGKTANLKLDPDEQEFAHLDSSPAHSRPCGAQPRAT